MKPTFLLCPGAARCGTTWLHYYLSSMDNVDFGMMKEYNIWNCKPRHLELYPNFKQFINRSTEFPSQDYIRELMHESPDSYRHYFQTRVNDKITVTGDMTPAYSSVMETEDYRELKELLEPYFNIKIIFIMRDPIARNESLIRLRNAVNRGKFHWTEWSELLGCDVREMMDIGDASYPETSTRRANLYPDIIESIEEVFEPDQIEYLIFEDMFRMRTLEMLSHFLGVEIDSSLLNEKINVFSSAGVLSDKRKSEMEELYLHTYQYCNERFPITKELWRNVQS